MPIAVPTRLSTVLSPLLTCLLWLCAAGPTLAADPVLVVDDAHLQMQDAAGAVPQVYLVDAAPRLVVDARTYRFKLPADLAGKPLNSLQVVLGKDEQYAAPWSPKAGQQVLSAQTLKPNGDGSPFAGFHSGQQGVVAIGRLDGARFSVVWVGTFKVR